MLKTIYTFVWVGLMISCSTSSSNDTPQVREFDVTLNIREILFYGDTINKEPPLILNVRANTDKITLINLGNGVPFGVKYFVSERITGTETELVHNATFYEEVNGEWTPLNSSEHREPCVIGEEKKWGIGISNSEGEQYFRADFTYQIKEI